MNAPEGLASARARPSGPGRRIAAAVILSVFIFLGLWLLALNVLAALLIASGCCVVVIVASAVFDPIETVLDAFAALVFGVFGVIAAVVAAIFSIFGF